MALLPCWWPLGTESLLERVPKFEEQGRARLLWKYHDSWPTCFSMFFINPRKFASSILDIFKVVEFPWQYFQGHGSRAVFCASISPTGEFSYVGTDAKFGLLRLVLSNHFWQLKMEASGLPIANSLLLNWQAQHVIRPLNKAGRSEAWKLVSHTAYWHLGLLHTAYLTCSEDTYLHREYSTNLSGRQLLWFVNRPVCYVACSLFKERVLVPICMTSLWQDEQKSQMVTVSVITLGGTTEEAALWPWETFENVGKSSVRVQAILITVPRDVPLGDVKKALQESCSEWLTIRSECICGGWSVPLLFSWCWKWLRF